MEDAAGARARGLDEATALSAGTERAYAATVELRPTTLVGQRVLVFWESERAWFAGEVQRYLLTTRQHVVVYDDGDVVSHRMADENWRLDGDGGAADHLPPPRKRPRAEAHAPADGSRPPRKASAACAATLAGIGGASSREQAELRWAMVASMRDARGEAQPKARRCGRP